MKNKILLVLNDGQILKYKNVTGLYTAFSHNYYTIKANGSLVFADNEEIKVGTIYHMGGVHQLDKDIEKYFTS